MSEIILYTIHIVTPLIITLKKLKRNCIKSPQKNLTNNFIVILNNINTNKNHHKTYIFFSFAIYSHFRVVNLRFIT